MIVRLKADATYSRRMANRTPHSKFRLKPEPTYA
jgi:hypothetical protein